MLVDITMPSVATCTTYFSATPIGESWLGMLRR